jgi:hypothetical protein
MTAEEVAKKCGKSLDDTKRILWELAFTGVCFVGEEDGVDKYWLELWVPGHMEMIVNHPDKGSIENFRQSAEAFEGFGVRRAPMAAGVFSVGTGPMRVIPIETAIQGETRRASYEEISKYLKENTVFSDAAILRRICAFSLAMQQSITYAQGAAGQLQGMKPLQLLKRLRQTGLCTRYPTQTAPVILTQYATAADVHALQHELAVCSATRT